MKESEARWLGVDRRAGETLHASVERMLREAICSGALRPGVQLPSSRALARQLGVSRGIASEAYGQLAAQGFLVNHVKSAPVVADAGSPPPQPSVQAAAPRPPRY